MKNNGTEGDLLSYGMYYNEEKKLFNKLIGSDFKKKFQEAKRRRLD